MINSPVMQWGKNFIDKIDLHNYKNILDVGCRQGDISSYLAKQYSKQKFIAIDNIDEEIKQAKILHQHPNLIFESADALSFDYSENFEAVVSFSCLHWIHDKTKTLRNIYRALKPGGKAFIQFFALHGRDKNDRFFYQIAQTPKWKSYFKGFSPDYFEITLSEFSQLLHNTGFIIHRIEFVNHETLFAHPDLLHQWLSTWTSHAKYIPKQKHDYFLDDYLVEYLNFHHYTRHDQFPYYEHVLEVICEKPMTPQVNNNYQYGDLVFTKKELAVLKLYLQGKSAKEISLLTSVSAKTVEFHLGNIKEKLHCYRRSEIFQAAIKYGFINLIF